MDFSTILPLLNQNKREMDLICNLQQKKQPITFLEREPFPFLRKVQL